jgi:adenylate cyclase
MPPLRSSFASRLVALVIASIVMSTMLATGVSAWLSYRSNIREARSQALSIARLLARTAAVADEIPADVERVIAEHMIVSASAFAEFVAAAEKAGMSRGAINDRLTRLVDRTILDEVWISDSKGFAYLHKNGEKDFTFSPSAIEQPQAHEFYKLLTGEKREVIQNIQKREIDNEKFKYVGVGGVDRPRIVEVGYNARYFDRLAEQIGLQRVVDSLLSTGEIDAIFIFDSGSKLIVKPKPTAGSLAEQVGEAELEPVREVLHSGVPASVVSSKMLSVIAPINRDDGKLLGAALIRLPIDRIGRHIRLQLETALAVSVLTSLIGAGLAAWLARRQTAPIRAITEAARHIESERVLDDSLTKVAERQDELGQLARVFRTTAHDFLTREKTLDSLVVQRTAALEEKNSELERLSARLSKYLAPQLYEKLFHGAKVAPMTAQRKKLTILFADVVSFSEIAESLEVEDLTRVLNQFLNEIAGVALRHGATIDKYIGDAVMVFFGDPETRGVREDARACMLMALEILQATRDLEHRLKASGLALPFKIRIGVNTGYCAVGDFGSQQRMDYTIVGHQVNLAARIQKAAAPDSILISSETWAYVSDLIEAEEQAPLHVHNIHAPVRTYKVVGLASSRAPASISEERAGIVVKVDLAAADRSEALRILSEAMARLEEKRKTEVE